MTCSPAGPAPITTTSYEPDTRRPPSCRAAACGAVAGEVSGTVNVLRPERETGTRPNMIASGAGLCRLLDAELHPVLDCFLGGDRAFWWAHVVDRDVGALLTEADGDRLADARAAAGDQGNLVLQSFHSVLLM